MIVKRIGVFFLLLALTVLLAGCTARQAEEGQENLPEPDSGQGEENTPPEQEEAVTWTLDEETGTLTFTGTGPLALEEAWDAGDATYTYSWAHLAGRVSRIVIGEGITRVPDFAFYGFTRVTEVSLPSTLETVGMFAFAHCAFQELRLPESLEELEPGVFAGCRQLRSCTVPAGVDTLSQVLFQDCESLRQLELAEGLGRLKPGCLFGTDQLETVTLPATVWEVGRFFSLGLQEVVLLGDPPEILYPRDRLPYFLEGGTVYYPAGNQAWLPVIQQYQSPQIIWAEGTPECTSQRDRYCRAGTGDLPGKLGQGIPSHLG